MLSEFVHHHLCGAEDDAELDVLEIDQPAEDLQLRATIHFIVALLDRGNRELLIRDADVHRIPRVMLDEPLDSLRKGRREKHRLPLWRRLRKDLLDVFREAHIEHAIRFIENGDLRDAPASACRVRDDP